MKVRKAKTLCAVCKSEEGYLRNSGRYICKGCWKSGEDYRDHWFTKSLAYQKPTLLSIRPRKPLPGQGEFPFPEEEGEHHE
jgi:hypothetical protein